jgi:hypothetical protein
MPPGGERRLTGSRRATAGWTVASVKRWLGARMNTLAPIADCVAATDNGRPPPVPGCGEERGGWVGGSMVGRRAATTALFLLLPFVMLSWLLPFVSKQTIGNDYSIFALLAQLDMMWSVWKGTFPLYMPGFAGGHSTAAMTLGQLYHPISWISSLMPGYSSGLALEWNTFFRLLSLGLVHLVLFYTCRRLAMGRLEAFLCTFPVVYNLRTLDSFRYAAALEGYTGMLLVAATGILVFLDERSKGRVVLLAISTYLTAVSGHPQWAFLGMDGAMLFLGMFPWLARTIQPGLPALSLDRCARYYKRIGIGLGTGALLSAPYGLTFFFEFFRTNQTRAGNTDYAWTLGYADSLRGELANFLLPLHADVHGAFGGSALFLVAAMLPLVFIVKRPPAVLLVAYATGLLAFLFSLGDAGPIHMYITQHVPLFESLRTPGRIVIWIPVVFFPILAWLLRPSNRRALVVAGAGAFLAFLMVRLGVSEVLPLRESLSPHKILGKAIPPFYDSLVLHLSGATILFLLLAVVWGRKRRFCLSASLACTLASTWLCLSVGTWKQDKSPSYSFNNMIEDRTNSPIAHAAGGEGFGLEMRSVAEYRKRGLKSERPLGVIVHGPAHGLSDSEILQQLQSGTASGPVFVDGPLEVSSEKAASDYDTVSLVYNTSNRFRFNVVAARDGYFVLGLPMLPGFVCRIDGSFAKVVKANALYPSVFLPRGFHVVDFYFISWPFVAGGGIALGTLWVLIHWVAARKRRSWARRGMPLAALLLAVLFWVFVYAGPSFNTSYFWQVRL